MHVEVSLAKDTTHYDEIKDSDWLIAFKWAHLLATNCSF